MGRTLVLCVDDEEGVRELVRRQLGASGYEVLTAASGEEGFRLLRGERDVRLVVADQRLGAARGLDFLSRVRRTHPGAGRILITGYPELDVAIEAVNRGGISAFLCKPWKMEELIRAVRRTLQEGTSLLRARRQVAALRKGRERCRALVEQLQAEAAQQGERMEQIRDGAIFSLALLAERRDGTTGHHLERTRNYCQLLGESLRRMPGFSNYIDAGYVADLLRSSPLHDIGKVGIPDRILLKEGPLSGEEFERMKTHTLIGGETLQEADAKVGGETFLTLGKSLALHHHERFDGRGYPAGLKGEEIPLSARILALADAYDAMASRRPYKEPRPHAEVREEVVRQAGGQFDPRVVEAFLRVEGEFERVSRATA